MKNTENAEEISYAETANVVNLLKRAFLFLSEGKYDEADLYAEKILDVDAENADAYLCKLLADLNLRNLKELRNCDVDFSNNPNYLNAYYFGDEKRQKVLEAYLKRASAYAAVENGEHTLETLKDCQQTARRTEADLNRKVKRGKVRGAVYIVAFAMLIVGAILLVLSWTSVMEFTAAAPVLVVVGISLCYLMFIFVCKSYYDLIAGVEADNTFILIKLLIFLVTLLGGFGIWGFVMSVRLLNKKKFDSSASDSFRINIENAENYLKELKNKAEMEDAALCEFLERENF